MPADAQGAGAERAVDVGIVNIPAHHPNEVSPDPWMLWSGLVRASSRQDECNSCRGEFIRLAPCLKATPVQRQTRRCESRASGIRRSLFDAEWAVQWRIRPYTPVSGPLRRIYSMICSKPITAAGCSRAPRRSACAVRLHGGCAGHCRFPSGRCGCRSARFPGARPRWPSTSA